MFRALRLYDPTLFFLAMLATGLGLLFIFDAGYARSLKDGFGTIPREFKSQLIFLPVALFVGAFVARVRPEAWKKWSRLLWVMAFVSLVLPMLPGIGVELNGAHRWIKLGPVMIQPAEFAKVAVVIYLAGAFAGRAAWPTKIKPQKDMAKWLDNIAIPKLMRFLPALWVLMAVYLIEKEPDLGTAAVVAAVAFSMFFIGGISKKSLIWATVLAFLGVIFLVQQEPYRLERIANHSSRWSAENMDDMGYQTVQSEMAMASGGLTGIGIGGGRAKHVLPAATTDFMLATIGEEFGLIGVLVALGVLGALAFRLFVLAAQAPTAFGAMILCGVGAWITIQTCVNVMMANGFLPAIGIPLPFYSSGGSSLVALWVAMGLCQSALAPVPVKEEGSAADRYRWGNRRTRLSRA
jgi:cell division protein FtsW